MGTGATNDISSQTVTFNANSTLDVNGNPVTLANSIGNNGGGAVTSGKLSRKRRSQFERRQYLYRRHNREQRDLERDKHSGSATGTNTVTVQTGAGLGGSGIISGSSSGNRARSGRSPSDQNSLWAR